MKSPKPSKSKKPVTVTFPKSLKWDKLRDEEIAELLDCHPNTVYKHRRDNKLPRAPRKPGSGAQPRIDISKIDMSKSIEFNRKKHKCSYNWMCMLMKKIRDKRAEDTFEF